MSRHFSWCRWRAGLLAIVSSGCAGRSGQVDTQDAAASDANTVAVTPTSLAESTLAVDRIEGLRARFSRVIRPGIGARFEPTGDGHVHAIVPELEKLRVRSTATVRLPLRASASVRLEDDASRVSVRFALKGASDASMAATAEGMALYANALFGADVIHRVHAEGTEDFVAFEERPAKEHVVYEVDVSRVDGLRLVSNTLEFLDDRGTPRLRIAPPYVEGSDGVRHEATLEVDGCAYDTSALGPWGRAITKPGATSCEVRVAWRGAGVIYPALVDPAWSATGSMATARHQHTATLLGSGKVLVAGGTSDTGVTQLSSAELFDPTGAGSFAATGSMGFAHVSHTATLLTSGKVLIAAGLGGGGMKGELFDAGTFTPTGSLSGQRYRHTATLLGSGKVLIAGGNGNPAILSTAELFDPAGAGTFTGVSDLMKAAREWHTATRLVSGKVLITGGAGSSGSALSTAEVFDPSATVTFFSATGPMATARVYHAAAPLSSGKVLVAGGTRDGLVILSSAELFDPAGTGSFVATGSMTAARFFHTATALASAKVLIAGGWDRIAYLSTAELFDPTGTGSFTGTAAMAAGRSDHSATLLASGKLLVTGGSTGAVLSSAEMFGQAAGETCALAGDCLSNVCEEGVCCSGACSGTCMTCTAGTGACVAVKGADDPDTCTGTSTCDVAGACKLKLGQPCPGGASTCLSGNCSDGFCCDTACAGACAVCAKSLGAATDGTCGPASAGSAGKPACASGGACNGTSVSCGSPCASDLDCLSANYCAPSGACVARKPQGAACNLTTDCKTSGTCRECTSGFCIDGVCCDTACNTLCQACAATLKQSADKDGTCGPAKDRTNPHADDCKPELPKTCGRDGKCNGSGACRLYYSAGTSCGVSACDASGKASGMICNGSGVCASDPGGVSCGDYVCDKTIGSCPSTCAGDTGCIASAYCNAGTCVPKQPNGAAAVAGRECASGVAADGVCCNAPCAGQCEACDVAGALGSCVPVSTPPHGVRPKCADAPVDNPCGATTCDGTTRTSCLGLAGPTVDCRAASCKDGVQTLAGKCAGKGACQDLQTKTCAPFVCDAATAACKVACAADTDCVNGNRCDPSTKTCVTGATCDGDHTTTSANGLKTDCSPLKCESAGVCKQSCASSNDCVAGFACDTASAKCLPTAEATASSGGCAMVAGRSSSERAQLALGCLVACAAALSRRRRSPRAPKPA